MDLSLSSRFKNAWNAFRNRAPGPLETIFSVPMEESLKKTLSKGRTGRLSR